MRFRLAILVVSALALFMLCGTAIGWANGRAATAHHVSALLRVTYVDVGQGDSIILRVGKWTGLIDGGPAGSSGVIAAQLHKLGATHIDCLVMSHSHADHIGGLPGLISQFKPRRAIYAGAGTTATWRNVKKALAQAGTKLQRVRAGAVLAFGKLKAKVISPSHLSGEPNDDSVVILLDAAGRRFLFTGDLNGPNEAAVGAICARGPPIYVLKVAHHGSKYSTGNSFLAQARPKFAVISVGKNSYGHPAPATINRLKAHKTRIYSTQKNGNITVTVKSNGKVSWTFSRSSKPVTSAAAVGGSKPAPGSTIVYITDSGECYHRAGCIYLAHSKIPITLAKAKAEGYRPCKVCKPPT